MINPEMFYVGISQGKMGEVKKLTQECLSAGEKAESILKRGLLPAMEQIGVKFRNSEIYIPEVLIAARAMDAGMAILKPILSNCSGS